MNVDGISKDLVTTIDDFWSRLLLLAGRSSTNEVFIVIRHKNLKLLKILKVLSVCLSLIKVLNDCHDDVTIAIKLINDTNAAVSVLIRKQLYFYLIAHDASFSGSWCLKYGHHEPQKANVPLYGLTLICAMRLLHQSLK